MEKRIVNLSELCRMDVSHFTSLNENNVKKYLLRELLDIKDSVSFKGIILEHSLETEEQSGKVFLKLRDLELNDSLNVFLLFNANNSEHNALISNIETFDIIQIVGGERMISQNLSIYCKVKLRMTASNIKLSKHMEICNHYCPCNFLERDCFNSYGIAYKNQEFNLPLVHLPYFPPIPFMGYILQGVVFRNIISVNCLIDSVNYFYLEYLCCNCKKNVALKDEPCVFCNEKNIIFNIKSGIILDDGSALAKARVETIKDTSILLQFHDELMSDLEDILIHSGQRTCTLSREGFPLKLAEHIGNLQCVAYRLAIKVLSPISESHDAYTGYILEFHKNSYTPLNSLSRDRYYQVWVKVLKVLN